MSTLQKTPLHKSLPSLVSDIVGNELDLLGKAWPCSIVDIDDTNTIVVVQFELKVNYVLPQVTCPVAFPEYVRWPLKVGDKGFTVPAQAMLAGVDGLGGQGYVATLDQPFNLSALVFVPLGNSQFTPTPNPEAVVLYGPDGVMTGDTPGNVVGNFQSEGVFIGRKIGTAAPKGVQPTYDETVMMNDDMAAVTYKDKSTVMNDDGVTVNAGNGVLMLQSAYGSISIDGNGIHLRGPGGANMDLTASGISIAFAGGSIGINPSGVAGLYAPDGTTHVSAATNNAQLVASGASVAVSQNYAAANSSGNIDILAPNSNVIQITPARVGIQGMDFKQHEHGGVQTGGSFTAAPSGP